MTEVDLVHFQRGHQCRVDRRHGVRVDPPAHIQDFILENLEDVITNGPADKDLRWAEFDDARKGWLFGRRQADCQHRFQSLVPPIVGDYDYQLGLFEAEFHLDNLAA